MPRKLHFLPPIRTIGLTRPLHWLVLGWRDMLRAGWISVAQGLALALFGAAIFAVAHHRFWLLAGALSGFLVVAPVPVLTPLDFLRHVVLAREGWLFEIWLGLGSLMAAPIFASSVVAMPLLLDRRATLLQAVLTSWKAVVVNPLPMALWAALILGLTLLGLGSLLLGLVVVMPVLGHASWHAYRDLVDASGMPEREPAKAANVANVANASGEAP